MDEDCNVELKYQGAEASEQNLRDLDARVFLETANYMQEKFEHKHAPADHEQALLHDNRLYDLGSLTGMQI